LISRAEQISDVHLTGTEELEHDGSDGTNWTEGEVVPTIIDWKVLNSTFNSLDGLLVDGDGASKS